MQCDECLRECLYCSGLHSVVDGHPPDGVSFCGGCITCLNKEIERLEKGRTAAHDALTRAGIDEWDGPKVISVEERIDMLAKERGGLRLQIEEISELVGPGGDDTPFGRVESALGLAILTIKQREAFGRMLTRIGGMSSARWDQWLRHDVGDEDADALVRWVTNVVGFKP